MDMRTDPQPAREKTRFAVHESLPPLLRGIGTTVILLAAIIGAANNKWGAPAKNRAALVHQKGIESNSPRTHPDESLDALTHEVAELREAVGEETMVEEVLANPWFESLGMIGSGIVAASFYADWLSKRTK